jgi:thiol-disulfide isomerase/thioredoxin
MAEESTMVPLGTPATHFELIDTVSGRMMNLDELKSDRATVILFICNHCPYVKHVQHELVKLAEDYQPKGVTFVAISPNDPESYPEDGPQQMKEVAERMGYPFPYLFDEIQDTARAYKAACTPDIFVYDGDLLLAYRGQLDGSRPGNDIPITGKDLRTALDDLLAGKPVNPTQKPSMGCSIKWKA